MARPNQQTGNNSERAPEIHVLSLPPGRTSAFKDMPRLYGSEVLGRSVPIGHKTPKANAVGTLSVKVFEDEELDLSVPNPGASAQEFEIPINSDKRK